MEYEDLRKAEDSIAYKDFLSDKPTIRRELFDWLKSKELTIRQASYLLGSLRDDIEDAYHQGRRVKML